jgi:hypothetical protein
MNACESAPVRGLVDAAILYLNGIAGVEIARRELSNKVCCEHGQALSSLHSSELKLLR